MNVFPLFRLALVAAETDFVYKETAVHVVFEFNLARFELFGDCHALLQIGHRPDGFGYEAAVLVCAKIDKMALFTRII